MNTVFWETVEKIAREKNKPYGWKKELARKIGIGQDTISKHKKRNTEPRRDIIIKIARYLDVSLDELLLGVHRAPTHKDPLVQHVVDSLYGLPSSFRKKVAATLDNIVLTRPSEHSRIFKTIEEISYDAKVAYPVALSLPLLATIDVENIILPNEAPHAHKATLFPTLRHDSHKVYYISVPYVSTISQSDFAVQIQGNTLHEENIQDGDICVFAPSVSMAKRGDIVLFQYQQCINVRKLITDMPTYYELGHADNVLRFEKKDVAIYGTLSYVHSPQSVEHAQNNKRNLEGGAQEETISPSPYPSPSVPSYQVSEAAPPPYEEEVFINVPHYTGVAAGPPIDMNDSIGTTTVPRRFLQGDTSKYYTLSVQGNSMSELGITDGCTILVRDSQGEYPQNGAVYVMRLGESATVKKLSIEFSETGQPLYYCLWCDGSNRRELLKDSQWAILGAFVYVVQKSKNA